MVTNREMGRGRDTLGVWNSHIHTATAAAAAKSLQSCPTLCDPIDGSQPGSPVPGILIDCILKLHNFSPRVNIILLFYLLNFFVPPAKSSSYKTSVTCFTVSNFSMFSA